VRLLGWVLKGDCPTGSTRRISQFALHRPLIHFYYDTIYFVLKLMAVMPIFLDVLDHLLKAFNNTETR
jgi:hypothetical protein